MSAQKKRRAHAAAFLILALGACPKEESGGALTRAPLAKAAPSPAPQVALLPEERIRDLVTTPTATWAATEGSLLRFDASGARTLFGPKDGLEFGEAIRVVSEGDTVAIAGRRGVYLYQGGVMKRVPLPNDPLLSGYQPTDLALRDGELWAIFGPQASTLPLLCGAPTAEIALPKVFRLTGKGAEPLNVPAAPEAIAASPEGLWVSSGDKLYVLEAGFSQFREMALDKGADVHRLQVDPKGRVWALTDQGLFGGTAKQGVEAIEGGEFFAGPREALSLGFLRDELWIATSRGVYQFDGKSWQRFEFPKGEGVGVTSLAIQQDTVYIGSTRGLLAGKPGAWSFLIEDGDSPNGAVRAFTRAIGKVLIGTASEPGFELNSGGLQRAIEDQETEALIGNAKPTEILGVTPKISKPAKEAKGSSPRSAVLQTMEVKLLNDTKVGVFAYQPDGSLLFLDSGLSTGVLAMQQSREGNLWVAGRRGIRQLRLDGTFAEPEETRSIGARSITIDKKGALWFAAIDAPTGRGLGLYGRIVGSWTSFTTMDGMPSNELYAVAAQANSLYIAQPKGITQVSEKGISTTKLPGTIFQVEAAGADVWAAGCQEVFRRDGDSWLNYANVPNGVALAMVTDARGRLFAGNRSGLYLFKEERWVYLPGAGGVGVSALQIIEDDGGKQLLWIGAESGAVLAIPVPE